MSGVVSAIARAVAIAGIVLAGTEAARAAGALAIGSCAAYGYAYDFPETQRARLAALAKCAGKCKVVATMQGSCAAYAIDGRKPCGPHGYATAATLGKAQNAALSYCYKYGGHECVVRAWACDGEKKSAKSE
jgi:hypothetical protein